MPSSSSSPASGLNDLKSFCPETVDCFLEEAEELMKAAESRKRLGQWDRSYKYLKLVHKRLKRLVDVADLQMSYSTIEEADPSTSASPVEKHEPEQKPSPEAKNCEQILDGAAKVMGPSGVKAKWTEEELDRLYVAAQKYGSDLSKENMIAVAKAVGSRNAAQCRSKLAQLSHSERITHEWIKDRLRNFNYENYYSHGES